jgi:hypothetical protein
MMGFEEVNSLDVDKTVKIGGVDKKTGKKNPSSIEGYYLGAREIADKYSSDKMGKLHAFQTAEGNVGVFGKTDLNRKLAVVIPGTMVRVTAAGSVPTNKGNDMLKFKVEVDKTNMIEVSGTLSDDSGLDNGGESDDNEDSEENSYSSNMGRTGTGMNNQTGMSAAERQAKVQELLKKKK